MKLRHVRSLIVLFFVAIVTIACAAQPTATPTPAPTAIVTATPTLDLARTATAQAEATATTEANASATASARFLATAGAAAYARATESAIAQATATNQARATTQALVASAEALAKSGGVAFGPASGIFPFRADNLIPGIFANLNLRNLVVQARFFNPADGSIHPWDCGFVFRNARFQDYRLYLA